VPLTIRVLRQLDAKGEAIASDELVEVAKSSAAPVKLLETPGSAAYEQSLDVTLPADGVYLVRIDGKPIYVDPIPERRVNGELFPRLVVTPLDPAAKVRPTWRTYPTPAGGVGVPADSAAAVTLGTAGGTLTGAGPGVALRAKPDLLGPASASANGAGVEGPAAAAGFAGGAAATLLSVGVRPQDLLRAVNQEPGKPLELPPDWLNGIPPRPASPLPRMIGD
jgi:hypothetical protein